MVDDRFAHGRAAGDDVRDAAGQVRQALFQHPQGRQRRQLRRLDDDRIAGGDRRRDLPRQQQQRIVERDDAADDAERLLDREVDLVLGDGRDGGAVRVARNLRVVVDARGAPFHLVEIFDAGLAAFAGQQLRQAGAIRAQRDRHVVQQARALHRRHLAPACLRIRRALHRRLHVGRGALIDFVDCVERGGILNHTDAAATRGCGPAVNPELPHEGATLSPRLQTKYQTRAQNPTTTAATKRGSLLLCPAARTTR